MPKSMGILKEKRFKQEQDIKVVYYNLNLTDLKSTAAKVNHQ